MDRKLYDLMDWAGIEELVYSESANPHELLGPHITEEGVLVQMLMPTAKEALVVVGDKTYPMELADEAGFFAALLPRKTIPDYTLKVTFDNGVTEELKDPYAFSPQISEEDLKKFEAGIHYTIYEKLGAHPMTVNGVSGVYFAVWAPCAMRVSVVGDFNLWDGRRNQMRRLGNSGVFEIFMPDLTEGTLYKYEVKCKNGDPILKADPYGNYSELRPHNASIVWNTDKYQWKDQDWMKKRAAEDSKSKPMSIYEVHLGSWMRKDIALDDNGNEILGSEFYNYKEIAVKLADYVKMMGYTHVELMPVMEHPLDASWGYQVTGYYAPTSRYGTPDDFMYFMDYMHEQGIGVILDWVPAHFPRDSYGLAAFDGTCVYEHADPRQGSHPHWGTLIYNYGRPQVSNYLIANALFWVEKYHADGIRMDAVASMLYLDYGRQDGEWIPNMYGGNENLEAIELIKHLNSILKKRDPGVLSIAEESTAFPLITGSLEEGGLGFDLKWNMGFMNDYLDYIKYDPYFRSHHHGELTFSMIYAYSEKFMLVFSHDEVVHGKGTLLGKMPGDRAQKLANLRLTYGYMMTHPGKKLLFMGQDLAEEKEWNEMRQVEWQLEEQKENAGVQKLVKDLNVLYRENKALYECDDQAKGFQWMNEISANECYVSFVRKGEEAEELLLVVANFSGVPREITTGVPYEGKYKEILNTDAVQYGGTGVVNDRVKRAEDVEWDDKKQSVTVKMAPLSLSILQFIPYTEAELEKVIEKRIRKNTPIRKTAGKTTKRKQEK